MCDFLDMNGRVLMPYDKVQFWSPSYKDWVDAEVMKVEFLWVSEYDSFNDIWRPIQKKSITVKPHYVRNYTKYVNSTPQKLRNSENIKKV